MISSETEVVVIGAGAAGIAAARRLQAAGVDFVLVEARDRVGGRAWTVAGDWPLDLGCGWLHSADRNQWRHIAESQGRRIDRTRPPWGRQSGDVGFTAEEQAAYHAALGRFWERLEALGEAEPDRPAAALLEPGNRWNSLIDAVMSYINGAELDQISARDLARYDDSGVNWRVADGYGTVVAAHAAGLEPVRGCPVARIAHSGRRLVIETAMGNIEAAAALVTVPSAIIAEERLRFAPALPDKVEAAAGLPLGLADKLVLAVGEPEAFEKDGHLFGRTDTDATGSYHLRPFGRPLIEGYFGGSHAGELEAEDGFAAFAIDELAALLGNGIRRRLQPIAVSRWRADPFARGSYSYALPGRADDRARLAAPVDGRLFFAGEATSTADYSTAHGAHDTGLAAAEQIIRSLRP